MMMKKLYGFAKQFLMLSLLMVTTVAFAQEKTITGTITDGDSGETLVSASVVIKGTTNGTVTDFDGKYSLKANEGDILVYSFVGYTTQERTVGTAGTIDVVLSAGKDLDEVVVIGYGAVKKTDLTGAVSQVGAEDFNKGIFTAPNQLIQGKVAGVSVVGASGAPGAATTIRIRGASSARPGNQPLYVVDGIPLDGRSAKPGVSDVPGGLNRTPDSNPLSFLNPNDIASMNVLKDASATAIYGSRGANGVIIITTKKGSAGAPKVDLGVSYGISSILNEVDILDGNGYRAALAEVGASGGDFGGSVNAFDEILQTAATKNYNAAISGGNQQGNYRVSLGLTDQEGIIKESSLKTYNGSLRSSYAFLDNDKLKVDINITATHTTENTAPISDNAGFEGSLIGQALQWNPTRPLFLPNGDFDLTESSSTLNPVAFLAAHDDVSDITRILASVSPSFQIADGLTAKYFFSVDNSASERRFSIKKFMNMQNIEGRGYAVYATERLFVQQHTFTLNYLKDLSDNVSLNAVAGYEYQEFDNKGVTVKAQDFVTDNIDFTDILGNSTRDSRDISSFHDPVIKLQSYFGRANINLSNKYLLTATVRADGSSRFGANNRYGVFPSVGLAWNLHNEDFAPTGFNELKLRASWGQTGNQEFPAGSSQERWSLGTQGGLNLENVSNPDLKWESTESINVGLDFALFDYKLRGSVNYFTNTTNDLIFQFAAIQPAPDTKFFANFDGEVQNSGVEVELNGYLVNNENLTWDLGVNAAFLSNELSGYNGPPIQTGEINGQGLSGVRAQRLANGQPLFAYFLREWTGEFDENGQAVYVNNEELRFVGDPNPDLLLGLSTSLSAGNLDVSMSLNGAFGHQVYNNTANAILVKGNIGTRNTSPSVLGNGEATSNPVKASTRYLEDADYIRLNNISVGYNFDTKSDVIKGLRLFVTGQNLLVFTNYTGFDPEVNTNKEIDGVPSFGIEYTPYPAARTFILGANLSF